MGPVSDFPFPLPHELVDVDTGAPIFEVAEGAEGEPAEPIVEGNVENVIPPADELFGFRGAGNAKAAGSEAEAAVPANEFPSQSVELLARTTSDSISEANTVLIGLVVGS